jgi:hypothetical protein
LLRVTARDEVIPCRLKRINLKENEESEEEGNEEYGDE